MSSHDGEVTGHINSAVLKAIERQVQTQIKRLRGTNDAEGIIKAKLLSAVLARSIESAKGDSPSITTLNELLSTEISITELGFDITKLPPEEVKAYKVLVGNYDSLSIRSTAGLVRGDAARLWARVNFQGP